MLSVAPLVGNDICPAVKGDCNAEDVLAEELVDRSAGDGLHAALRVHVETEVSVGVDAVLLAPVVLEPVRVRNRHHHRHPFVQQEPEPGLLLVVLQDVLDHRDRGVRPDPLVAVQGPADEERRPSDQQAGVRLQARQVGQQDRIHQTLALGVRGSAIADSRQPVAVLGREEPKHGRVLGLQCDHLGHQLRILLVLVSLGARHLDEQQHEREGPHVKVESVTRGRIGRHQIAVLNSRPW